MTYIPRNDNVLVLLDHHRREERRTAGGLIIPEQHQPDVVEGVWGTVIASGPGYYTERRCRKCKTADAIGKGVFIANETRPGDRVLVETIHVGDVYPVDGVEHRIVRESEIVAICEREGAAAE